MDVIGRVPGLGSIGWLRQQMAGTSVRHRAWTREHGEDLPEIMIWLWPHEVFGLPLAPNGISRAGGAP